MRPLRQPDGKPITDDDYLTCKVGLHLLTEKVFATMKVACFNNALQYPCKVIYCCPDCADHRLGHYRDMFNFVEVEEVGKVKRRSA